MVFLCVSLLTWGRNWAELRACIRASAHFKVKYPPSCCRGKLSVLMALAYFIYAGWYKVDSTDSLTTSPEQTRSKHKGLMDWWIIQKLCFHSLYINFDHWYHPVTSVRTMRIYVCLIWDTFQSRYKKEYRNILRRASDAFKLDLKLFFGEVKIE